MRKILVLALVALACVGCATTSHKENARASAPAVAYELQVLHFSDVDGNEETSLGAVDEFSALVKHFRSKLPNNTILISSGDNIIPGPRFYAAEQKPVRKITGSNEPGHADVALLNALGVDASALGNHELDASVGEFVDALSPESYKGVEFPGAKFPYLSCNIDFSGDKDIMELRGKDGLSTAELAGKIARYAIKEVGGKKIGIIGASTPWLATITDEGDMKILPESGDIKELAAMIQTVVDELKTQGIDIIVLTTHMQQIVWEKQLAELLDGVDIIVAGGSNTRMGDHTDTLFAGDEAWEMDYPYATYSKSKEPVLVVNVDGDYKYLGRLVAPFDTEGKIILERLVHAKNGMWTANERTLERLGATPMQEVVDIQEALLSVIDKQFKNVVGYTKVYLDGRRSQVRTQETNLAQLTSQANLWYANLMGKEPVQIALKNGGGIRTEIGSSAVPPGAADGASAVYLPPAATKSGLAEGAISEGHLRAVLRFDNGLVTIGLNAEELLMLIEHGLAKTGEGRTSGAFPQVAGMSYSYSWDLPAGERVLSMQVGDTKIYEKGTWLVDKATRYRLVTLNFLANGGDAYPFDKLSDPQRRNLYAGKGWGEKADYEDENLDKDPGLVNSFSKTGGEQDAFAEYLMAFHATPEQGYDVAETPEEQDKVIVRVK